MTRRLIKQSLPTGMGDDYPLGLLHQFELWSQAVVVKVDAIDDELLCRLRLVVQIVSCRGKMGVIELLGIAVLEQ